MRTIDAHPVRFGELAGPLVHGSMFFDWELISTQEIAEEFDYPFEQIVENDGIPYAPVVARTSVSRYPTFEDTITVETVPRSVGDSSVELVYEMVDSNEESLATAHITHVTIAPEGGALELPEETRQNFANAVVETSPTVGPDNTHRDGTLPSFSTSFPIRSPHIEGSELAYFEEYPRFADVALEEFLNDQGTSLASLRDEKQPFRIRDWKWEFNAPVPYESTLNVECDVLDVQTDTVRIAHTLRSDEVTCIEAITEYGCFDRQGHAVDFDAEMLEPFVAEQDTPLND